jgi:hypothetical protein
MALAAIGAGLMAGSSLFEGFMGSRQKKNEEAIGKYNASVARRDAEAVKRRTKFIQSRHAEMGARVMGELEAGIGGSGLVSTEGAPAMALALQKSELDIENFLIGMQGRTEANQLLSQAQGFDLSAAQAKIGSRQALIGGFLGAAAIGINAWSKIPKKQTPKTETWGTAGYSTEQLSRPGFYDTV